MASRVDVQFPCEKVLCSGKWKRARPGAFNKGFENDGRGRRQQMRLPSGLVKSDTAVSQTTVDESHSWRRSEVRTLPCCPSSKLWGSARPSSNTTPPLPAA